MIQATTAICTQRKEELVNNRPLCSFAILRHQWMGAVLCCVSASVLLFVVSSLSASDVPAQPGLCGNGVHRNGPLQAGTQTRHPLHHPGAALESTEPYPSHAVFLRNTWFNNFISGCFLQLWQFLHPQSCKNMFISLFFVISIPLFIVMTYCERLKQKAILWWKWRPVLNSFLSSHILFKLKQITASVNSYCNFKFIYNMEI